MLSLWSLASSPLIIGTDLTDLCASDLTCSRTRPCSPLTRTESPRRRYRNDKGAQILAKTVKAGDVVVGLFDTRPARRARSRRSTTALGIASCSQGYRVENLWSGEQSSNSAA